MAERCHRGEGSASDEPHEAYAEAERRLWPSDVTAREAPATSRRSGAAKAERRPVPNHHYGARRSMSQVPEADRE